MPTRSQASETIREEAVNTTLAQLLRERGLSARGERRSRRGAPDVRVELRTGDSALIECKWNDGKTELESQLNERLSVFPETLGLIGVLYPDRLKQADDIRAELASATDLQWWLHGSRGRRLSNDNIRSGSIEDVADHLLTLPLELEGADRVAAAAGVIGYAIERSAQELARHERIARRVADVIAQTDQEKNRAAALRIGCLVLFNAVAFQDRLAEDNANVPTVRESWRTGVAGLRGAWRKICVEIDYVPVFELAADVLDILDDAPRDTHSPIVSPLLRAAEQTRQLEGHDLSGRLFHTLLTDAKFTGAYYTSVPAATLLARLVFHGWPAHVDWGDYEFPASLNVADLACGTGTLLMAVAAEAERRHTQLGGRNAAELHKAMVEQALHGYDVQLSAIHFAATSLAMLNPHIEFDRMNLYVMPLGAEGTNISLGSLDFLGADEVAVQFALSSDEVGIGTSEAERVSGRGSRGAEEGVTATLPELDLAIMNPPFTRSVGGNLLFGSLPGRERTRLQKELSRRLKSRQASATAGLGSAFVSAAAPKLRPGEGRLALVLPVTVCTGPSWAQTRALIERDFDLDMVITSHDPERWNFSDSTDLSEALLIATRRADDAASSERWTTFVNLWRNPDGVLDAHRAAQAITETTPANLEDSGTALLEVDGKHIGETLSVPASKIAGKKWFGIQFARADLVRSAISLLGDGVVRIPGESATASVPLCPLGALGDLGPDRRDLWDGFAPTDTVTAYPMLENHDTNERRRLVAEPNKYLAPLVKAPAGRRLKRVDQLWPKSARLLIAERLRLNTVRVVTQATNAPVLSNVWWPMNTANHNTDKALSIYLNSSIGILTLLSTRNTTEGGWVDLKKTDLRETPVLDTRRLSESQIEALAALFDDLADAEFERLPAMADCDARKRLDDGLSDILGLPSLDTLRRLLASEPVVSNRQL